MADTYELDLEPGADDFEDEMVVDDGIIYKINTYIFLLSLFKMNTYFNTNISN